MSRIRHRIEKWFASVAETIYRHRIKTLVINLLFCVAVFSQLPKIGIDTSTEGFLHASDPTLIDYNAFRDQFGRDELIVIAIQTPDVFTGPFLSKLKRLHDELESGVPYL